MRLQIVQRWCAVHSDRHTDQRLTAHGGLIVVALFAPEEVSPAVARGVAHDPTSPNAYDPADVALGYVGGILCGADKLSRVAWLQSDPAVAEVLGVEAITSQSTLSRFFGVFTQKSYQVFGRVAFPCGIQSADVAWRLHAGSGFVGAVA